MRNKNEPQRENRSHLHFLILWIIQKNSLSICIHLFSSNPFNAHRSWSRVRDSVLIRSPVMFWPFSVGERAIEGGSDIIHVIHTYCIAFEHRTAKEALVTFV